MSNHSFDIHIATEYKSIELAIMIWHFQYWIMKNKRLKRNLCEGRTWTYQTQVELTAVFPYWSRDQVKRLLKKCLDLEILIKGNFNKNAFDQTVWYAFKNEERFGITQLPEMEDVEEQPTGIGRFRPMDIAISPNQLGDIAQPIPNTLPNTLPNKYKSDLPAGRAALSFYEKLAKINPKVKKPNLDKWAKEFEILAKDGNSEQDIEKAIDYVISTHDKPSASGFCWANVVLSPQALRKNFAKIWGELSAAKKPKLSAEDNQKIAKLISKSYKGSDLVFGYDYLEFINGQYSNLIKFDDKEFRNKCLQELSKRKINLSL